ncbi:GNAT family N-acetyltransferase [Emticicia sp. BO119]|uniref:GNAT family N-acetyltransferase n=1 Tax=Emticicia sp. BO119 TaxID=2757768 RepID=UPI0015F063DE|nr:GNAT family N-acetyltransferase [Emticicia sp. BO119]MBA4853643.1 GNAT family N-acetyltransferase [Emticicia sp. BO119]
MNLIYRYATITDISVIREIARKTWFATYEPILGTHQPQYMFDLIYSEEGLEEQMNAGQVFVLQSGIDSEMKEIQIAFASYSLKTESEKIYKLNKLYLNPDLQGGGLGKKLLIEIERQIRNLGGEWLDLNVNRYNKAKLFYERMGFEVIAEEDIPIGNYFMNDYAMRKKL